MALICFAGVALEINSQYATAIVFLTIAETLLCNQLLAVFSRKIIALYSLTHISTLYSFDVNQLRLQFLAQIATNQGY